MSTRPSRSRTLSFSRKRKSSLSVTSSPLSSQLPLPSVTEPTVPAAAPSSPPKGPGKVRRLVKRVASFARLRRDSVEGEAQAPSHPQAQQDERPAHTRSFSEPVPPKRRRSRAFSFISSSSRTRPEYIEPSSQAQAQQDDNKSVSSAAESASISRRSLYESTEASKVQTQSSTPLTSSASLSAAPEALSLEAHQTQCTKSEEAVLTPVAPVHIEAAPVTHAETLRVATEAEEQQYGDSLPAALSPVMEQPEEALPVSDDLKAHAELQAADDAVALLEVTTAALNIGTSQETPDADTVSPRHSGGEVEEPCAAVQIWRRSIVMESFEEIAVTHVEDPVLVTDATPESQGNHEEPEIHIELSGLDPSSASPEEPAPASNPTMCVSTSSSHPPITVTPAHETCPSEIGSETPESVVDSASCVSTEDSSTDSEFIDRTIDSILDTLLATMPPTSLPKMSSVAPQFPPVLSRQESGPIKAEVAVRSSRPTSLIVFSKLNILPAPQVTRMPIGSTLTWWLSKHVVSRTL